MSARKVLIVSPHFAPTGAPDGQRVRQMLPFLESAGWRPTVLSVAPEYVESPCDEWLMETVPDSVPVVRVKAISASLSKYCGVRSLSARATYFLRAAGNRLLSDSRFDLVYFSTSQFGTLSLGPFWKRRFGVPFGIDLQDPWVTDYYSANPLQAPPGGKVKYAVSRSIARMRERAVVGAAALVTAVSQDYFRQLSSRGISTSGAVTATIPFGAGEYDVDRINASRSVRRLPACAGVTVMCAGAITPGMHHALRGLFRGVSSYVSEYPARRSDLKIGFVGTSYAPRDLCRRSVIPLAEREGLGEVVVEVPERVPYSQALLEVTSAPATLIVGSNDPAYNPSKIATYMYASKATLALLHPQCPSFSLVGMCGGRVVDNSRTIDEIAVDVSAVFQNGLGSIRIPAETRYSISSAAMTEKIVDAFDRAVSYAAASGV